MSNEIWMSWDESKILYALIWRKDDDTIFDESDGGDTFETYVEANIANYNVPMTAQGDGVGGYSDYHTVDFPAVITTAGAYRVQIMEQASAVADTPDADDDVAIGQGELYWDGTAEYDLYQQSLSARRVVNVYDERETAGAGTGEGIESEVVHDP